MSFYQARHLPHWDPEDAALFITWRLHGSLPAPPPEWERVPAEERFQAEDESLAHAAGPHFLNDDRVAGCVAAALRYGAERLHLYELCAWVILSNHVHILVNPLAPLARITRSIKTYSAKEANRTLGRTGQPFWQTESYDHWVRNSAEFESIVHYIECNPVKAGLVNSPEEWRWSSAWQVGRPGGLPYEELHHA